MIYETINLKKEISDKMGTSIGESERFTSARNASCAIACGFAHLAKPYSRFTAIVHAKLSLHSSFKSRITCGSFGLCSPPDCSPVRKIRR